LIAGWIGGRGWNPAGEEGYGRMRLTLRTLLAWLDDTLPPSQVREIGIQVKESPLARELAERIGRVTRQRRLTVPGSSGPEGTDPNLVASYLDNDLDPEQVAEYEKKCLSSDVNLAEVASVHQILSLLGQRAKVPPEAKARMYQLVRGREARPARLWSSGSRERVQGAAATAVEWAIDPPPAQSMLERLGPLAVCLVLGVVAVWSAWWSVTAQPSPLGFKVDARSRPRPPGVAPEATVPAVEAGRPALAGPAVGESTVAEHPAAANPSEAASAPAPVASAEAVHPEPSMPSAELAKDAPAAKAAAAAPAKESQPAADLRPSVAKAPPGPGMIDPTSVLVLRYDPEDRQWERITNRTLLARLDRVLCLEPFRVDLGMGPLRLQAVGETEIQLQTNPADAAPMIELGHGRLLVTQPASTTLRVGTFTKSITIEASQDSLVGLERVVRRGDNRPPDPRPQLEIYCVRGEVTVVADKDRDRLTVTNAARISNPGKIERGSPDALPAWTNPGPPTPFEAQLAEQFYKMVLPARPIMAELVAAIEDKRPEIKKLAIAAVKALGDYSLLTPLLSRERDPLCRKATLAAIREVLSLSPEAASRMRDQLAEEFGQERLPFVLKMIEGHPRSESANADLLSQLVLLLGPEQESLGLRELALDDLKRITGRDDLGYDPDQPEGRGLAAWRELARRAQEKAQSTGLRGR